MTQKTNPYQDIILAPVRRPSTGDYILWSVLGSITLSGIILWGWQIYQGLGITGLNRPVYWGVYLTNFVFFIGLAHSGTFISAILRIAGQGWRKPLTRAAEAITLFSLPFGAMSILIDMGRPERIFNVIFYGRYMSPILWDFTAVGLYLLSSIVFFYLSLLPDIALVRDKVTNVGKKQKRMYEILSLGYQGTPGQEHRLERVLDGMAIFMTMLVVTVHTVVSWLFGMTLQPGWHTALIGPFFLLGAILSGSCAVVIVLAILRKVYHMQKTLPIGLFNSLRKLLIVFTLGWIYMIIAEYLTTSYGNMKEEMVVTWDKFTGTYSLMFWSMVVLVFIVPLIIFVKKGKNNIGWMVFASVLVNIGMWMERFIVIVPTEVSPRLLTVMGQGAYRPTWYEIVITISCFTGLALLYVVFTRFFPIIPIWETVDTFEAEQAKDSSSPNFAGQNLEKEVHAGAI
jgi:molybdopterin-containing oxidoreductase family membrane subunit